MKKMKTSERGKWAEDIAAHFLQHKGFEILDRNFNTRFGEIDIIALDTRNDESTVFVEVKFRGKGSYLLPEETLAVKKQQRLKIAAAIYMNRFGLADSAVRFDVICVSRDKWFMPANVRHIIDAF